MILTNISELKTIPKRIISLVPSQTELLHYLDLNVEVIGITKFCVYPGEWFRTKKRLGGTKTVNTNLFKNLHPDLVIANKEENIKEQIDFIAEHYPVFLTDVHSVEDGYKMITDIGHLTGKAAKARQLVKEIKQRFSELKPPKNRPVAAYIIWQNPYMVVGDNTFINDMMQKAGFDNAFKSKSRYPEITIEDLENANCDCVFLSSEPYPFKQRHIKDLLQHLPNCKINLVDGELFSWYGSRMLQAPAYFKKLLKDCNK